MTVNDKKMPYYVLFSLVLPIWEGFFAYDLGVWFYPVVFLTCSIPNLIVYWSKVE